MDLSLKEEKWSKNMKFGAADVISIAKKQD